MTNRYLSTGRLEKFMKSLIILIVLTAQLPALAQESKEDKKAAQAAVLKDRVDSKRFAFRALSALVSGAATRQFTRQLSGSYYTLTVLSDSVVSDLPYFGRLYQSPMGQDGGIKFNSTQSDYTVKGRKKGGWDIKIKTKDVSNSPQLYLTISPNGSASLRVSCTDRQSISYEGIIEEPHKK